MTTNPNLPLNQHSLLSEEEGPRESPFLLPAFSGRVHARARADRERPVRRAIPHSPTLRGRRRHGIRLVAASERTRSTDRSFWSGLLDQKHLDRAFLLLAASSALLLLLSQ